MPPASSPRGSSASILSPLLTVGEAYEAQRLGGRAHNAAGSWEAIPCCASERLRESRRSEGRGSVSSALLSTVGRPAPVGWPHGARLSARHSCETNSCSRPSRDARASDGARRPAECSSIESRPAGQRGRDSLLADARRRRSPRWSSTAATGSARLLVRGISGAVVTFQRKVSTIPRLWLAAEDEVESHGGDTPHAHFKVTTCTTCGQHYFVAFLKDFEFTGTSTRWRRSLAAMLLFGNRWRRQKAASVLILRRSHRRGATPDEDLEEHDRLASIAVCRRCGAAHPCSWGAMPALRNRRRDGAALRGPAEERQPWVSLELLVMWREREGDVPSTYREPARPVRATNVADAPGTGAGHGAPLRAAAPARLLRQPSGRRIPGGLIKIMRAAFAFVR